MSANQIQIIKDLPNKKIVVVRSFKAAPEQVWKAWTKSELLDQWWAPKPWKAETKTMDFKEGGTWLYAMVGPNGEKQWSKMNFITITPFQNFTAVDAFCDENGNEIPDPPGMKWKTDFVATEDGTKVTIEISFETEADLQKIVDLGFESGFTAALGNLDEYLASNQ